MNSMTLDPLRYAAEYGVKDSNQRKIDGPEAVNIEDLARFLGYHKMWRGFWEEDAVLRALVLRI